MKISSSDLLSILRTFNVASPSDIVRQIDQVTSTHPRATNQLVAFRFNRKHFYVLIDETALDDTSYITQQIQTVKSDLSGSLLQNPTSPITTYGLPYKGKDIYLFSQQDTKKRLDVYLAEKYPTTSRSVWQKHIRAGYVLVNGEEAKNAKHNVSEDDNVEVALPDAPDYSGDTLPIVYIDDDVIVIDKPAGVLTHGTNSLGGEFTVADFFRRYTSVGLDGVRPGIVHRLDRDTSGLLIGARNETAFEYLKKQFASRNVTKTYLAVIAGNLKHDAAVIDLPIARNSAKPGSFRVDVKGKDAITRYKAVESSPNFSLVELQPKSGRTHQLRVHMAHLGTPIYGDRLYGKAADRLYLHAEKLRLLLPSGSEKEFMSPAPKEFRKLLKDVHS